MKKKNGEKAERWGGVSRRRITALWGEASGAAMRNRVASSGYGTETLFRLLTTAYAEARTG